MPYTERHFARMSRLLQQSTFVEYTWYCMKGVATDGTLPSTSIRPDEIIIDRTKQTVDDEVTNIEASSSSESDMETDREIPNITGLTSKPDKIIKDRDKQGTDVISSSESDLDTNPKEIVSKNTSDIIATKKDSLQMESSENKSQKVVRANDKLRKKKQKQKMNSLKSLSSQNSQKLTDQFTIVKQKRKLKPQNATKKDGVQDKKFSKAKKLKISNAGSMSKNIEKKNNKRKRTGKSVQLKKLKRSRVR